MYANNFYIATLSADKSAIKFDYFLDEVDEEDPSTWEPEPVETFKQSLTGYLFRTGEALLADEAKLSQLEQQGEIQMRGSPTFQWMGIPLNIENQTIGVMVIQSYTDEYSYTEKDKELLIFVSQQIAAVLQQKRFEVRLKEYNEQLEQKVSNRTAMLQKINSDLEQQIKETEQAEKLQAALFKISELTNTSHDLDEFYLSVHKIINGIMPSKNFFISSYDQQSKLISFPYLIDEFDAEQSDRELDETIDINKCSPTELVIRKGKPVLINKQNHQEWLDKNLFVGSPPVTWLGVPLIENGQISGVLAVQSYLKGKSYTKLDEEVLVFVSQQVSTALERRKNADSLKKALDDLKTINDDLERRVQDRTQELSVTNNTLKGMLEERNKMQKKLAYEAFHDSLTGLPNRALFTNRLEQILNHRQRNEQINFSVLFLDLDRFKVINDSLGHLIGDSLLQEVAQRLQECVRPEDTVARLGGDEFCILLKQIGRPRDAAVIANRIIHTIAEPFHIDDNTIFTSTSIGLTVSNSTYKLPSDVLRDADAAMYHAKESGKNCYIMFDVEMHKRAMKRLKIESALRHAIEKKEIKVYFQPIIDIKSGRITAFEALARWFSDELGFISPDEFIPIAEETGLIHEIGAFVLDHSLATLKSWHKQMPHAREVSMSVNFSSKQIENVSILDDIEMAISENELSNSALKVEITEGVLIENSELAEQLLVKLNEMKIPVLLDDFGTGYSSLSYLHKFTLNTIKIDRSFVYEMDTNEKHQSIVSAISSMCHGLKLDIIAEGVESEKHLNMLRDMGIENAQGYHFSKPVPAEEARELIEQYNSTHLD
jgi:diguanylate cyclase (GGDEF)-like protein